MLNNHMISSSAVTTVACAPCIPEDTPCNFKCVLERKDFFKLVGHSVALYLVGELPAHNLELLCCSCTRDFERLNCDSPIRHWRLIVAPDLINQVADSWIGRQLDASRIEGGGPLPGLHVAAICTRSISDVQQHSPAVVDRREAAVLTWRSAGRLQLVLPLEAPVRETLVSRC